MDYLFAQDVGTQGNMIASLLPFILIGVIFYFFIIRPQSQQKKKHEYMINNLKKDDRILTRGGVFGKIINFQGKDNEKVMIDAGNDTKMVISRAYIVSISSENNPK